VNLPAWSGDGAASGGIARLAFRSLAIMRARCPRLSAWVKSLAPSIVAARRELTEAELDFGGKSQ
jgi:hypothetical protein